jgi:short-subunit dehydrogenase
VSILITGASRGIGEALAKAFAADGHPLALVARTAKDLERVKASIPGAEVRTYVADLADEASRNALLAKLDADCVRITGLVNNAGIGTFGRFDEIDAAAETKMIRLNVEALTHLAHAAATRLKGVPGAFIMNIGSMAGFQGVPYFATYAATKAFVLSFTEALAAELRPQGIHVMCVCPGVTATGFQAASNYPEAEAARESLTVEQVAADALRGLARKKLIVVPSFKRWLLVRIGALLPRSVSVKFGERMMRKALHSQERHS